MPVFALKSLPDGDQSRRGSDYDGDLIGTVYLAGCSAGDGEFLPADAPGLPEVLSESILEGLFHDFRSPEYLQSSARVLSRTLSKVALGRPKRGVRDKEEKWN
jgi:hypothetical protein